LATGRRRIFCNLSHGGRDPFPITHQWEDEREAWLRVHQEPWSAQVEREYHERFSGAIERWLDAGHGSCLLRRRECSQIVAATLRHFEGERVVMISFVVMPNHVHALFVQNPEWPLEKLLQSWKRFTTREINKLLGRTGNLWQRDYFDRLVRDEKHFVNCVRYIRRNPEKAQSPPSEFVLWESDTALAVL
jgi:putative transposase